MTFPCFAFAMAAILLAFVTGTAGAQGASLEVDPAGPLPRLTDALRIARPGDRIVVHPGHYAEPTIVIDRKVEILGQGLPVFDGAGQHQVFTILADSVTIRGLVIRNTGVSAVEDRAGIKVVEASGCILEDNHLEDTFFGIYLAKASTCRIANNVVRGSGTTEVLSGNAIHLWNSRQITVRNNDVSGHRDGVYLEFTRDAAVVGNRSTQNVRYGLHFMFSHGCTYEDNTFAENGAGVAVMYSQEVTMVGNEFKRNQGAAAYGLLLKDITDSRVEANHFFDNTVGLYLEGANRVTVVANTFARNGWAVRIMADAAGNEFREDRFIGNAFDVATNSTSNSSTFDGNYWDRYAGYDLDGDGYGDVPFSPVRLFSLITERHPPALVLLRSLFVDLVDLAERVLPVLTPETLIDRRPLMRPSV